MGGRLPLLLVALAAGASAFHVGGARPLLSTSRAATTRASPLVSLHPTASSSFARLKSRLSMLMSTAAADEEDEAPAGTSLWAHSVFIGIFLTGVLCVVLNYILWGFRMAIENVGLNWWAKTDVHMLRAS
jgi:hypothetical protein